MAARTRGAGGGDIIGGMYVADGSTAQTAIAAQTLMTGWAAAGVNGVADGMVPDKANNRITATYAGVYTITFNISFSGDIGVAYQFHLAVGGAEKAQACVMRKVGTGGDVVGGSFTTLVTLAAGDVITILVTSDDAGGADMTPVQANLVCTRLSGSG